MVVLVAELAAVQVIAVAVQLGLVTLAELAAQIHILLVVAALVAVAVATPARLGRNHLISAEKVVAVAVVTAG
jgi:hypothetical protein